MKMYDGGDVVRVSPGTQYKARGKGALKVFLGSAFVGGCVDVCEALKVVCISF